MRLPPFVLTCLAAACDVDRGVRRPATRADRAVVLPPGAAGFTTQVIADGPVTARYRTEGPTFASDSVK